MHYKQILSKIKSWIFWKKPSFILALILLAFFVKGVFLAALFPIFVGQDEAKHYNSIQFLAEPRPITWTMKNLDRTDNGFLGYHFSEEITETIRAIDYDNTIKGPLYSTSAFEEGYEGKTEKEINEGKWDPYNKGYPIDKADTSLYHRLASLLEKAFSSQSIFVRYFLARIFSVMLGTLFILLSYLIAKNIGFPSKISLLLVAVIAFQPRLSIYYAGINYDTLLILSFSLFTLSGILALKQGLNWKNLAILITSVILGIFSKATGYVLLVIFVFLLAFLFYKKIENKNRRTKYAFFSIFLMVIIFLAEYLKKYLPGNLHSGIGILISFKEYFHETITVGKFFLPSATYWGSLGWVNSWLIENVTDLIWPVELLSALGIILFFFSKKKLDFLPEKKYIIFFIVMIVALQLGIRFADWRVFQKNGSLLLGTPGRYFLPNITAHILLVSTGIGAILRKKEYFEKSLIIGLILMMTFMMYIIFDVIILRYYL